MEPRKNPAAYTTSKLSDEKLWDLSLAEPEIQYRSVPTRSDHNASMPIWRIRFDPTFDPTQHLGLDVTGEVALGRVDDADDAVSLNIFNANELGVSRQHAILRPTDTKLYILDVGSTNGTSLNGHSIGVNMPYSISNGDLLRLGKLEFVVRIIKRPIGHKEMQHFKNELTDALLPVARAITSQLTMDDVLKQALEMTISLTGADEASVWLMEQKTGELFLEANFGIDDDQIKHTRLSVNDTLAGKVFKTGKPVHANRETGGNQIKVKTGYLVDAVIYVPLTLADVTFGVLSGAHRATGKSFNSYDEKTMAIIADFAAIGVQNARIYEATNHALTHSAKVLTALNSTLAYDFKKLLNASIGYSGLLKSYQSLDEDGMDIVNNIVVAGNRMTQLIDQLIEATTLHEASSFHFSACDLVDVVAKAVDDSQMAALNKVINLEFQLMGNPYVVNGDANFLYRSVMNLLDNAVKFSPEGAKVTTTIVFSTHDVIIRVRDTGPGLPIGHLPYIFDRYFRTNSASNGQSGLGLGLGLELVRATVEAHRGTITARNLEPNGAEFMITLPNTAQFT